MDTNLTFLGWEDQCIEYVKKRLIFQLEFAIFLDPPLELGEFVGRHTKLFRSYIGVLQEF